jgi:hypothetical protein
MSRRGPTLNLDHVNQCQILSVHNRTAAKNILGTFKEFSKEINNYSIINEQIYTGFVEPVSNPDPVPVPDPT